MGQIHVDEIVTKINIDLVTLLRAKKERQGLFKPWKTKTLDKDFLRYVSFDLGFPYQKKGILGGGNLLRHRI